MLVSAHNRFRDLHLSPPAGRGRIASAIRVRGALRKGGGNRFKNAGQIARDIIVPKPHDTIIAIRKPFITDGVALAFRMLSAVNLHDQTALATDKIYGVRSYRLLPRKFVAIQPTGAKAIPERAFRFCHGASQSPRTLGLDPISTAHAETPPHPSRFARRPLPASGERRR